MDCCKGTLQRRLMQPVFYPNNPKVVRLSNTRIHVRVLAATLGCLALLASDGKSAQAEPKFEIDTARIQREHAEIERLMRGVRFHVFVPDSKFQDFLKTYRRNSDVVETAKLGFLSDPSQPATEFIDTALKKDAWKKPMDTPLSFICLLPLRTAQDWVRVNYVGLHDRNIDLEVDHLCPVGAAELEKQVLCVIEIPLGGLSPGSFHFSTKLNAGQYTRPSETPEGWEYADVSSLKFGGSGASGCTIVDPATNTVPLVERPPVRPSALLTEARLDQALEMLRRAKFPVDASKLFEIIGFTKEQQNRPALFGSGADGPHRIYELTGPPIVHLLDIQEDEARKNVLAARIYYLDDVRVYTLYDSRMKSE